MTAIYMDNAATSFPKPESVYEAVDHFNRYMGGNPGRGSNQQTLEAGSVLLNTRETLARFFNIKDSADIAFTLNITESINTGLKGMLRAGDHVITSSMEHNAVARPLNVLRQHGIEWTQVACSQDGSLDPEDVRRAIKKNTRMICILHASNLTGTIMPIREIGHIARNAGVTFLVDSAQTAGVLPIDVELDNIDILTFTGHKGLLGPQGTGGIYISPRIQVKPLKEGGTGSLSEYLEQPDFMPDILESGTLNTPGIAGLGAGLDFIAEQGLEKIKAREQLLTNQLLDGLQQIPGVTLYGPADSNRRTAVLAFNLDNMDCGELSTYLDYEFGITTRSGLHCSPLAHQTIGTLAQGACRLSPGYFTEHADVIKVLTAIDQLSRRL
ncbi:Pyridoxal phosphate-dependent transferase [Syntrophomonas zehnderi OL-4]|uniref:cysteine desulfurase n=1 Tax=Syntrophomonas zehnderi OL-4 TaxID=690567 RepID=A0A0E4G9T6_9FIRM|nr:aminotransferase class V-fold PLP-dependent enzyme [Syntrophomonas zehnderi]CFX25966.1 Pyridoxal phosphate-dependent transferase [Syntrophomonas zehnderi OL-4]